MKEYITLTVDGKSVKIEKGSTLLEAARKAGADIPTLCHDERVKPYGACGMCVVECKGSPKLMRSCAIEAADGMEIITESDRINRARRFSLEMLLSDHTGDCKAPCSLACPAGTDCQGYVGLIANGENAQALSVIKGKIPLPASIGRVCPHPCEKKCRRGLVEEPISIAALKAYAADRDLESGNIFMPEVAESTGKKVAIIGGGPGGISAAYYLAIKGHGIVYSLQLGCAGDKQAESTRTLSRPARVQFSLADTVFHFRALYRCGGSYRYSLGSRSFDASVFLQDIKNRRLSDYPVSFMGDIRGVSQHRDMHYKLKTNLPQTFVSHAGGVDFIRNISADNHREPR